MKKIYLHPEIQVVKIEPTVLMTLSGGEQGSMGVHTGEDINASGALSPSRRWHNNW